MDAVALARLWAGLESAVEEHAKFPPGALNTSVWSEVADGKLARPKKPGTIVGVKVLAVSREEVWLAITDDDPVVKVTGVTQFPLAGAWAAEKYLYQFLDLPWPLADRHWVLRSNNNRPLAQSCGVWERSWALADDWLPKARDRIGTERFDAAVTMPLNEGSWLLAPIDPTHTLGIYQARADLGGMVPESAAEAYSVQTLPRLFGATEADARSMRTRYGPACAPQPGADGQPIPCFSG